MEKIKQRSTNFNQMNYGKQHVQAVKKIQSFYRGNKAKSSSSRDNYDSARQSQQKSNQIMTNNVQAPSIKQTIKYSDGSKYIGEVVNNKRHGEGVFYANNRDNLSYEGDWQKDLYHGNGVLTKYDWSTSYAYVGEFKDGKRHGKGYESWHNSRQFYTSLKYEGEWKNDKRHGKGKNWCYDHFLSNLRLTYEGEWQYGKCHGRGTSYHTNGKKEYEGQWKNDQKEGYGILYNDKGVKQYEGQWAGDKKKATEPFIITRILNMLDYLIMIYQLV